MATILLVSALALAVGVAIGFVVAGRSDRPNAHGRRVEKELDELRRETEDYRTRVHERFTRTAIRFKALDESYAALHRELAESAHDLCDGDQGAMLERPREHTESASTRLGGRGDDTKTGKTSTDDAATDDESTAEEATADRTKRTETPAERIRRERAERSDTAPHEGTERRDASPDGDRSTTDDDERDTAAAARAGRS